MYLWLSHVSTWLFVEILATSCLILLNLLIPILMMFSSYRSLVNFYLSSTALSSALIDCLYLFYLIQNIRSKNLSEINCRAFYYLQTSSIVVLAYTIVAMHANFILQLFPSDDDDDQRFIYRCFHRLRRCFRRICFCFVLGIWSLSFTSTVPLLYTIDSNEKSPKPVYCPGTKEITYLQEWFDQNRLIQTILFNLIPLIICICLSLIALLKLISDALIYFFERCRRLSWIPCRTIQSNPLPSFRQCFINSFLRLLLVISCCLLACIYPIVMRFYIIYFSVFVPLIFGALNFSRTNTTTMATVVENQTIEENPVILNRTFRNTERVNSLVESQPPIMMNLLNKQNPLPSPPSPAPSSSSTALSTPRGIHRRQKYPLHQRNSFVNHIYENIRNISMK